MKQMTGYLIILVLITASAAVAGDTSTLSGVSRTLNPAISVNGLMRAQVADKNTSAEMNGFQMDGVEAQFTAMVDPFWKANVILGLHPVHAEEDDAHGHATTYEMGIEEAVVENRSMSAGLGLKAGRFRLPFGKSLPLHMHQYAFADAPLGLTSFFGDHSPTENGVQIMADVPLPWYSDLNLYGVSGESEAFDAANKDLAYGARLTNLWDVTDDASLELSGSWLHGQDGRHPGESQDVDFLGVDLTWKWVSSTRTGGPAVTVTGEVLFPQYQEGPTDPVGWYALAQYRFSRNWWLGAGLGQAKAEMGLDDDPDLHAHGFDGDLREYKLNLTFAPSEFSFVRGEVGRYKDQITGEDDTRAILQVNFTIGSHPAHMY